MDSVGYDEFGRVYIRPTHYAQGASWGASATPTKVILQVRLCVICEKKLSIYNTDKNNVCFNFTCEKKFKDKS